MALTSLIRVSANSEILSDSFERALERYESVSDTERVHLKTEQEAQLRLTARRLQKNGFLLESMFKLLVPSVSSSREWTKRGRYIHKRHIPFLKRHWSRQLQLERVFLPGVSLTSTFIKGTNFSEAVLVGRSFEDSVVLDSSFANAHLQGANFSRAVLKSSRFGKTLFLTYIMENPTTFQDAQLCDADFRETSFVKPDMRRADMTRARMYGASILDSEWMGWEKTTWWRADYDQADWTAYDPNALRNTGESLELLSTSYHDDLPANLDELDQSVRKFIESTQRKGGRA